ncbi:MAG: glycosyltransferase [Bacteroidales bacterium]
MLKICFLADGQSIHTQRWCDFFSKQGHEIHLITFRKSEITSATIYFIDVGGIDVSGGNWKTLLSVPKIRKILKEIKPDILHAHYATSYGITGALCNFKPYIITTLGSDILLSPQQSIIIRKLLKFAFIKASWITAMAEHMKSVIIGLGADESKVSVVPFGIDPLIFNANNRQLLKEKFVITSTRNFEPVYNIPHLLKSVAKIKNQIQNIQLNLIGDGSQRNSIEKMVSDLGLKDCTVFFGKIPQPQIAEILNQSHIFITVSLSDGNNISLNEAMACGVLCVATDIPANNQWINDGENGFLVKIDDIKSLAEIILISHLEYDKIQQTATKINFDIIEKRAIWMKNMKVVEEKYFSLIKKI